jgi:N-alpha-acetyl-L-2,4-diaminobutyrate deacetylase
MNYPAFQAGTRTSPIDQGNMNRSFPGKPDGTMTQKIADYFQRYLLPISDYVVDIHAGGKTLDFIPFAAAHILDDKDQQARCVAAMEAFAAPYSLMLLEIDSLGMYDNAAEDMGKVFVSTELGGGGSASAASIAIADRGLKNILKHAGIMKGAIDNALSQLLDMPDGDCFIFSEHQGLVEYCSDLGAMVRQGDLIVRIYDVTRTGADPACYYAKRDGLLTGRHFPGLVGMGDCLVMIADHVND